MAERGSMKRLSIIILITSLNLIADQFSELDKKQRVFSCWADCYAEQGDKKKADDFRRKSIFIVNKIEKLICRDLKNAKNN